MLTDFGPDKKFFYLYDRCFNKDTGGYTYELCPFKNARQAGTSLGNWEAWQGENSKMKYSGGASCWQGPDRSLLVTLVCGKEEQILKVDEPSRCAYSMIFSTPAACDRQHLALLQLEISSFNIDAETDEKNNQEKQEEQKTGWWW